MSDPGAWVHVVLWGAALSAIAFGAWRLGKRIPQWAAHPHRRRAVLRRPLLLLRERQPPAAAEPLRPPPSPLGSLPRRMARRTDPTPSAALERGGRLARKAAGPSLASSLAQTARRRPAPRDRAAERRTAAPGPACARPRSSAPARRCARPRPARRRCPPMRWTSPRSWPRSAPHRLGGQQHRPGRRPADEQARRCTVQASTISPSRLAGMPKKASIEATRRSQAMASCAAGPEGGALDRRDRAGGQLGEAAQHARAARRRTPSLSTPVRSAPAQNVPPAPVSTTRPGPLGGGVIDRGAQLDAAWRGRRRCDARAGRG